MASGNADIKSLGMLVLGLLVLAVLVGATFLVSGSFLTALCDQADTGSTYDGASCENSTGVDFTEDPTSVQRVEAVIAVIATVLSFLAIVVIVGIAKIILKIAKGMQN